MKTRPIILLLLVVGIVFLANKSIAANLVKNGSFEVNNSYSGWTFSGGLMVLGGAGAGTQCADGYNAVGLSWQSTLYQDVPTIVGQQYRFSFYMACWGPDRVPSNVVSLIVFAGSNTLGTVSFDGTGKTYQNMGWRKSEYIITATTTMTRIGFSNPAAPLSVGEPMIDDVWLTPAEPTPKSGGRVAGWGNNSSGQILFPNGLSNVKQVSAGGSHSLALKSDGTVAGWGNNTNGAAIPLVELSNILGIAAGGQHSLALRANGTVVAWGYNGNGQTNVPPYLSDVIQISAGLMHSLALKADGTVVGWGGSSFGEGYVPAGISNVKSIVAGSYASLALKRDGTVVTWGYPLNGDVPSGLSNVVAIAGGHNQNLALKADGTVVAWGIGYSGQTNPPPGLSNVVAISAGPSQSLALKADGSLVAWGSNSFGLTNVPPGLSNVTAIAAGGSHNLAIVPDGPPEIISEPANLGVPYQSNVVLRVEARGFDPLSYRWLFKGLTLSDSTRIFGSRTASLTISNAQFSDIGSYRVVVSNALGSVQSTGATLTVMSPPIFVQHPLSKTVIAGTNVLLSAGAIGTPLVSYQWLFNGEPIAGATKTSLSLSNVQSVSSGSYSVIASNAYGATISSNALLTIIETAPYILNQPTNRWTSMGGGATFSVNALGTTPLFYQWRHGGKDIPAATNATLTLTDLRTEDEGYYTVAISNSIGTTVSAKAFLAVSQIKIWGAGIPSALTNFPAGLSNVISLSAGNSHIVALKADGTVTAWGSRTVVSTFGHSFTNTTYVETNSLATNVPPNLNGVTEISAGASHNLALKSDGTVIAWGDNTYGQTNVPAGLGNVIAVAAGGNNSLALKADSSIVAWGGQSLRSLYATPLTNVPVGLSNLTSLAAGKSHGMALQNNGRVVVWGSSTNVPSNLSNVVAIAFRKDSSLDSPFYFPSGSSDVYLAMRADGSVFQWADSAIPPVTGSVVSGLSNAVAISGGVLRTMALKSDGRVFVSETITNQSPQSVSNVVAIAAGGDDGANVLYDGALLKSGSQFYVAAIGNGSPAFTLQPANQIGSRGSEIRLHARAAGVQPLRYQWQLNGTNISGATNGTLVLTNLQAANLGVYHAVASNALGVATSRAATITIPTSLPLALNATALPWTTTGPTTNAVWFPQFVESHDNYSAAQSGRIVDNQQTELQTTVTGPGTISYWWKTSSEEGYDFLRFFIGETNAAKAALSGGTGWQQRTFAVPAGTQLLKWSYSKDSSVSAGVDAGWVDEVSFTPDTVAAIPQFSAPQLLSDGSFAVSTIGGDGAIISPTDVERFELQASTNLIDWFGLTNGECSLRLTNGCLMFRDNPGSNFPVRFYRLINR